MSRRPTSRDVAEAAGVSQSTVSIVLTGKGVGRVKAETARLVRATADRLGYRPNTAARDLRLGQSRTILLVVPTLTSPFFGAIYTGAARVAAERGFRVLVHPSPDETGPVRSPLDAIDGVLASSLPDGVADLGDLPVIMLDSDPAGPAPTVNFDVAGGMRAVVEHLTDLGHHHIGHLAAAVDAWTFRTRATALTDTLTGVLARAADTSPSDTSPSDTSPSDTSPSDTSGADIRAVGARAADIRASGSRASGSKAVDARASGSSGAGTGVSGSSASGTGVSGSSGAGSSVFGTGAAGTSASGSRASGSSPSDTSPSDTRASGSSVAGTGASGTSGADVRAAGAGAVGSREASEVLLGGGRRGASSVGGGGSLGEVSSEVLAGALGEVLVRGVALIGMGAARGVAGGLLERGVTALVCDDDVLAAGAFQAARDRGLAVPGDVSITGFDDMTLAEALELTTVRLPAEELGARAMAALLELLDGGRPANVSLPGELIVRRSTGRLRS